MNPLIFATGSLLALFWALVSVLANVFRKQDAPPQAVRPPPRRTARKGAASPPTTPSMHPNTIQENALETVSLSSDSAGPSTVSDEREPLTPDAAPDVPPSLPRSSSTASTSAHSVTATTTSPKPRRTFSEFKVAFSRPFVKRRSSGGSTTDSETMAPTPTPTPPPPPSRRDRSRSSSRTRTQMKSIFTGIGRNRTTSSPASSEFLLTPSDSPLPLHAMGTTCKPLDETLMPSVQVTANPGLPASLPSTAATRTVRRVSAPIPSSSGPNSASLNTLALGVHFVLPPQPRPATGTGQELASSSLGLETNPVTLPLPPSHIDTSEPPRGRRPFWKPSFSRRTSIDMAQQSKHDKENASGTDSEATSSRFKRGRHSLSLARPSKVAVPPILTVPVESPTTPTPSDTTPTTPAASSPVTISRKSTWMEKRERSRSAERAPVKDRHARCAEIAHTAWGPATTEPGKRPRTPRAGSSSSIITSPAAPVAHATTSRPSRP